jgi:hypothetical protein
MATNFLPPQIERASATSSSTAAAQPPKSLAICNPFASTYHLLPPLGSAWARHGTVLAGPGCTVLVLTELAALSYTPAAAAKSAAKWMKHPLSLPSKPRSPVLTSAAAAVFALCDVGTPWRSQWKLFSCPLVALTGVRGGCEGARGPPMQMMMRPQGELSSSCGLMIWLVNRWFVVWLGSGDRFGLVFASSVRSVPI